MSIPVIDFSTQQEVSNLPIPAFYEDYKSRNHSDYALSRVYFISKKISFVKTASTKGISDVSGTTKKPYKQKGTGNARQGSLRSPQYRGGGIIFGPQPITAHYKINKKEKIYAKKILFSKLIHGNNITVVNNITVPQFNTKEAHSSIVKFNIHGYVALIHNNELSYESSKSFSNIKNVGIYNLNSFGIYEIVKYDHIIITQDAFKKISEILSQ